MLDETDRAAIVATLHRYCTAIDTGAWSLMGDVFVPTARVDYTGAKGPVLEGSTVGAWLRSEMSRFAVLQHYVTNVRINVEDGEILSQAYVFAVHGYQGTDGSMRFFDLGGEYRDRLVDTKTGWRIADRRLVTRFVRGDVPKG